MNLGKVIIRVIVIIFAIIGLFFSGVFIAIHFGWTDVRGSIDSRNNFFVNTVNLNKGGSKGTSDLVTNNQILCSIHVLNTYAPETADRVQYVWETTGNVSLVQGMLMAATTRFLNSTTIMNSYRLCSSTTQSQQQGATLTATAYAWSETPEWQVVAAGLIKDQGVINQAAQSAGIPPRLLISVVIPEQLRFFTSDRESYKKYFEPLKILGNLSQFSLGISGIKPETATEIENNLKDATSPYYLGPAYENLLAYAPSDNHNAVLYNRLTDTKNHYYQYLYTALFIKEIEAQWQNAGYPISVRPEIIATLFNLGFDKSVPKANPLIAGTVITIGGENYSFGRLGYEFYYSGELVDQFPY